MLLWYYFQQIDKTQTTEASRWGNEIYTFNDNHRCFCNMWRCADALSHSHFLLQGIFLHTVAISLSRESSLSRDWTDIPYVSCIGGRVLYHERHLGSPQNSWSRFSNIGLAKMFEFLIASYGKTWTNCLSYQWDKDIRMIKPHEILVLWIKSLYELLPSRGHSWINLIQLVKGHVLVTMLEIQHTQVRW